MVGQEILEFVQFRLTNGDSNQEILDRLCAERSIVIALRTLQRWISQNDLIRQPAQQTAYDRASAWLPDAERLVRNGTPYNHILYHIEKVYGQSLSKTTLRSILRVHIISGIFLDSYHTRMC